MENREVNIKRLKILETNIELTVAYGEEILGLWDQLSSVPEVLNDENTPEYLRKGAEWESIGIMLSCGLCSNIALSSALGAIRTSGLSREQIKEVFDLDIKPSMIQILDDLWKKFLGVTYSGSPMYPLDTTEDYMSMTSFAHNPFRKQLLIEIVKYFRDSLEKLHKLYPELENPHLNLLNSLE